MDAPITIVTGAYILVGSFVAFAVLWVIYLAVMNLNERKDMLKGANKLFGTVVFYLGLIWDFIVQVGPASLLWVELPREMTVSARVARHCKASPKGGLPLYRHKLALWFRDNLLKPFDESGGHG